MTQTRHARFARFTLVRDLDITGVTGTGEVAYGVRFPNGSCVLCWEKYGTHSIYKNIDQLIEIHCYRNNAIIHWVEKS